jgi:hypothetical protein
MAYGSITIAAALLLVISSGAPLQSPLVLHKGNTPEYHRPWCAVVRDGRDVLALTRAQAEARGLRSHEACEKEPAEAVAAPSAGAAGRKPAAPLVVFVDSTRYYHRDKCAKAVGPLTSAALDAVGKSRWPCPSCRPPVRRKSDGPAVPERGRRPSSG